MLVFNGEMESEKENLIWELTGRDALMEILLIIKLN